MNNIVERLSRHPGIRFSCLLKGSQVVDSNFPPEKTAQLNREAEIIRAIFQGVRFAEKDYQAIHLQGRDQLLAGYRFKNDHLLLLHADSSFSLEEMDQLLHCLKG